jgi:phosphonate transport system substrate-binding protein
MKINSISRILLLKVILFLGIFTVSCQPKPPESFNPELTIGVVSYGDGTVSLSKYDRFKDYLGKRTRSRVELEPAFNELQAIEQIQRQKWDIVFAPPGLAAIAISQKMYIPVFSMEGVSSTQRSLLVVREDQPYQQISDLKNKVVGMAEIGSAAGYYVPLYDLYGLTLAQIKFASTPKVALSWLDDSSADAVAIAERDFEVYRREFPATKFKVLHTSRWIPSGVVLMGPSIDITRQNQIQNIMREAPSDVTADAGYITTAKIPKYDQFIQLINKVRPLEERVKQQPAVLLRPDSLATPTAAPQPTTTAK